MTEHPRLPYPISIVMPVFNEEEVIEPVLQEWQQHVLRLLPVGSELLLDDASTDRTPELLASLQASIPMLRVIRSKRDGFRASALRLYRSASCQYVFFTDSDGQYVPEEFWKIAAHIGTYDLIHGYKQNRQDPAYRKIASAGFNRLMRVLIGVRGHDVNSAFRLVSRPLIDALLPKLRHLGTLPNAEMYIRAARAGYRILDVPVAHRKRAVGISRSLPARTYVQECLAAFNGLLALRRELSDKSG